jgi:hypothetical protein
VAMHCCCCARSASLGRIRPHNMQHVALTTALSSCIAILLLKCYTTPSLDSQVVFISAITLGLQVYRAIDMRHESLNLQNLAGQYGHFLKCLPSSLLFMLQKPGISRLRRRQSAAQTSYKKVRWKWLRHTGRR